MSKLLPDIVHPKPPEKDSIVELVRVQYQIHREERDAKANQWKPIDIDFTHDPFWRERYFSIQTIRDVKDGKCTAIGPTILWTFVDLAFSFAMLSWILGLSATAGFYWFRRIY